MESKDNHSRFIPYKNNIVRFSVDAFLFKEMPHQVCHELGKLHFDFSPYVAVFTKSVSFLTSVQLLCCVLILVSSCTCTAACLWAVPAQRLQPSPATTTPTQEGEIFLSENKDFEMLPSSEDGIYSV